MSQNLDESSEWDFDAEAACEAMREYMDWQVQEWKRERMEEMYGCESTSKARYHGSIHR